MSDKKEELDYCTMMSGLCSAPWDDDKCGVCGGVGLKPIICCNGFECGCRGMPVDFKECGCGIEQPKSETIKEWTQ